MDESQKHYAKWKKPDTSSQKGNIIYASIIGHSVKGKTKGTEIISAVSRSWGQRRDWLQRSTIESSVVTEMFYMLIETDKI